MNSDPFHSYTTGQIPPLDTSSITDIHGEFVRTNYTPTYSSIQEIIKKMSAPSMDLKILLAQSEEDQVASAEQLKEMNEALQMHIRQLLDEKKELLEVTGKAAESSDEERKYLEARISELSIELETTKADRSRVEFEEISNFRDQLRKEKEELAQRKNALKKKFVKLTEFQETVQRKEELLKDIDMKMRIRQKKLFFKKQTLESEFKRLDEMKDQLGEDAQNIEKEWQTVSDSQLRLQQLVQKVIESKRELRAKSILAKENIEEMDRVIKEYKSQLLTKEELAKKFAKQKEKEDQLIEQDMSLRKERENVVTMRLKMNEELRQLNLQKRVFESMKSEFETLQSFKQ